MKPVQVNSEPRVFMAGTVLLMFMSVTSMLTVELASNSSAARSAHPTAQAIFRPVRTSQGVQVQALRARITRLVAYFARLG